MRPIFQKMLWVDKNCTNMLNIRTEYPIDTNFSVQSGDITNFDESEKYILVYLYTLTVVRYTLGSLLSYFIQRMWQ